MSDLLERKKTWEQQTAPLLSTCCSGVSPVFLHPLANFLLGSCAVATVASPSLTDCYATWLARLAAAMLPSMPFGGVATFVNVKLLVLETV